MRRYLLDTNTVSYLLKGNDNIAQRIQAVPISSLCVSVVTEAELLFGLAKLPHAKRLHRLVKSFLQRVDVLPWDREVAVHYGKVRAKLETRGKVVAPLDLLIAAQAMSLDAILVTSDQAISNITGLKIEDWR